MLIKQIADLLEQLGEYKKLVKQLKKVADKEQEQEEETIRVKHERVKSLVHKHGPREKERQDHKATINNNKDKLRHLEQAFKETEGKVARLKPEGTETVSDF